MITICSHPERSEWPSLLKRPVMSLSALQGTVQQVFDDVRANGDEALRRYEAMFDKAELDDLRVGPEAFEAAEKQVDEGLKTAIRTAAANIRKFHEAQLHEEPVQETMPGVRCWRRTLPIEKVGLYVPGGSAPLFSTVLMLGIPAGIAGCRQIVLCSPPSRTTGEIAPAVLYAAKTIGITDVFRLGGIQAVAAMTFGTASVPAVYKILGPGNQYVQAAKQFASMAGVAIDMPAGPSEVLVVADDSCRPAFVASDLLSQAEHGPDSQVILLTNSEVVAEAVRKEVEAQTALLPRREIAEKALSNSRIIILSSLEEMMEMSNLYAPEHLILSVSDWEKAAGMVTAAGSVFLGNYAPESAGDYASGTNHSLPTSGYAHSYSGVSVDSFIKKTSFQYITKEGFSKLGPVIETMAEAEELFAHRQAATLRLQD